MQQTRSGWARIIEVIDKPLGFYVLALLIVESFLTIVLTVADLEPEVQERGMWAGVGLFMIVVGVVSICVWHKPHHLIFTELGSLIEMGKVPPFGTETKEVIGTREVIEETLPSGVSESEEET